MATRFEFGIEFGEEAVGVMRELKATLDPRNLLNPGKVI